MRIGIDPGISGAIAVLDDNPRVYDMPVSAKLSGKGNQVDPYGLAHIIANAAQGASTLTCYVEQVGPMPKQGVTSVFSFGRSAGVLEGVLAAFGLKTVMVRPQAWKKRAGLLKADKDAARTLAMQTWPSLSSELSRKKDVGRADALLIALHGDDL